MKKLIAITIVGLTLAITASAAPVEVSITGKHVSLKKGNTEYLALVTHPSELVEVHVWTGSNCQVYTVSYELPTHRNDDGTITLGVKDWWKHETAWQGLNKSVKFTGLDKPRVEIMGGIDVIYFLEDVNETSYTFKAINSEHRCHYPKGMLAYPPPLGKQFRLGISRNLIVTVIVEKDGTQLVPVGKVTQVQQ